MSAIAERSAQVSTSELKVQVNLTMFPLLAGGPAQSSCTLANDALAKVRAARPGAVETIQQELYLLGLSRVHQPSLTGAG